MHTPLCTPAVHTHHARPATHTPPAWRRARLPFALAHGVHVARPRECGRRLVLIWFSPTTGTQLSLRCPSGFAECPGWPPGTGPGRTAAALLTCRGPGLDVPRAVDHGVLRLPFLHGAQAVPVGRRTVKPPGTRVGGPGGGLLCI